jgi:nucleoid DNA-binding protein
MFRNREISDLVAEQMNLPRDQVRETIMRFQGHVIENVSRGERVHLRNFGTFKVRVHPPRKFVFKMLFGKKREEMMPESRRFHFHFSPTFRRRVEWVETPLEPPTRQPDSRRLRAQEARASRPWWRFW